MAPSLIAVLSELSEAGKGIAAAQGLEEFQRAAMDVCVAVPLPPSRAQQLVRELRAADADTWARAADAGANPGDVARALNALMRYSRGAAAGCAAATVYAALLAAPASPAYGFVDGLAFSGLAQRLKDGAFGTGGGAVAAAGDDDGDAEDDNDAEDDDDDDEEEGGAGKRATKRPRTKAAAGKRAARGKGKNRAADASSGSSAADAAAAVELVVQALDLLASALATPPAAPAAEDGNAADETAQQPQQQAPLPHLALRSYTDARDALVEALPELAACCSSQRVAVSRGAFSCLRSLVAPAHGSVHELAAAVLRRLSPLAIGTAHTPTAAGGGGGSNANPSSSLALPAAHPAPRPSAADAAAARSAVVDFSALLLESHPSESVDAVSALARHVCLRAPDRAEYRAAAVKVAADLAAALPAWEQEQFVGFLHGLARSPKVALRMLAPPLAAALLTNLPEPFAHATFVSAATGPLAASGRVPEGHCPAPWSAVCLGVLLGRCSDKQSAVRARALSELAAVVDTFSELLSQDPASEQYRVAEAFAPALGGAGLLRVASGKKPAAATEAKKKKGGEEEEDEDEEDAAEEENEDAANTTAPLAPRSAAKKKTIQQEALEAYMPARLTADLRPLLALVRRRCRDEKAGVRRAALSLLEAVAVMRASWSGLPRLAPSAEDAALLEDAAGDRLVSVRKAGAVALGRLLELFPEEGALARAWVSGALPLARDPEAAVQDAALDWARGLLLDKAVSAAAPRSGGKRAAAVEEEEAPPMATGEAAAETAAELRVLLSAVAASGRAASACLGRLCAALRARGKLDGRGVARGLEALVASGFGGVADDDAAAAAEAEDARAEAAAADADADQPPSSSTSATKAPPLRVSTSAATRGAWMLLREVAAQDPSAVSWRFLQARWGELLRRDAAAAAVGAAAASSSSAASTDEEGALLLMVISHAARNFPADQARALGEQLLRGLQSFALAPAVAGAHVAALHRLSAQQQAKASASAAAAACSGPWSRRVYASAHEVLRRFVKVHSGAAAAAEGAVDGAAALPIAAAERADLQRSAGVALFTVGEVALLRAAKPPSGLVVLVQALTAPRLLPSSSAAAAGPLPDADDDAEQDADADAAGAEDDADDGGFAPDDPATANGRPVPPALSAHAWAALGKACLADEQLAKRCVPRFVHELGRARPPACRNNIMVALADLVVAHTALVDAHVPKLAACIRDPHELVRRQALALLANLLLKDYVKWRGALFHRFLLALVDPSPGVRSLAEYLLTDALATKAPLLAYNHFVEAMFVLNGCAAGPHGARVQGALMGGGGGAAGAGAGAAAAPSQQQQQQFTLQGPRFRAHRDLIYSALLRRMAPEHKFSTQAKLCAEVLAGVADGALPLAEASEVLRDALGVLAGSDVRVTAQRLAGGGGANGGDDDDGAGGGGGSGLGAGSGAGPAEAAARARGRLVSSMMRKHLVESVVPVLVELRRLLQEQRHPLQGDLLAAAAAMLRDYKSEVEDILVADKQLAKEILYDLRQAEAAAKAGRAAQAAAAAGAKRAGAEAVAAAADGGGGIGRPLSSSLGAGGSGAVADDTAVDEQPQPPQQQQQFKTPGKPPSSSGAAAAAGALPAVTPATALRPATTSSRGGRPSLLGTAAKTPGGRLLATPAPLSGARRTPLLGGEDDQGAGAAAAAAAGGSDAATAAARRRSVLLQKPASGGGLRLRDPDATTNVELPSPFQPEGGSGGSGGGTGDGSEGDGQRGRKTKTWNVGEDVAAAARPAGDGARKAALAGRAAQRAAAEAEALAHAALAQGVKEEALPAEAAMGARRSRRAARN
jgi:condensin-2 complex subunit D3